MDCLDAMSEKEKVAQWPLPNAPENLGSDTKHIAVLSAANTAVSLLIPKPQWHQLLSLRHTINVHLKSIENLLEASQIDVRVLLEVQQAATAHEDIEAQLHDEVLQGGYRTCKKKKKTGQ